MQSSQLPTKIQLPFGKNAGGAYIRTIPVPSQIGINNGEASYNDGFPPLCFLPDAGGGINPDGRDFNGILNALSALLWWYSAGGPITYDATFQTEIGGYPKGAIIQSAAVPGIMWLSTAENNTNNPDTGGASWTNATPFVGSSSIVLSNSNITLSLAQYGVQEILLTGTLTANVNIILPNLVNAWDIKNNTSGNYTVTAKTAAGTGVIIGQGFNVSVIGDATNIYLKNASLGIDQSWNNETSSRGLNSAYGVGGNTFTNQTSLPIQVNVTISYSNNGTHSLYVGSIIANQNTTTNPNTITCTLTAIVPPGASYQVVSPGVLSYWAELR